MFEVGLAQVCEEINQAFTAGNHGRVEHLLWPALDQFNDNPQLWFYAGNLFFQTGRAAMAAQAFEKCLALDENPLVMANLGAAYRRLNQHENGIAVLKSCIERYPDYEPALVNFGAMYVNEGTPESGIPALERAVAIGRAKGKLEKGAEWNLGLLYLEAGRLGEGFDIYRNGYGSERLVRSYAHDPGGEPLRLTPEAHSGAIAGAALKKERPTLIVWGEQGLGDELMFATTLCDAIAHYDVIFECHPRLESIYRNARFARLLREEGREVRIYPTRKESAITWSKDVKADYKCPVADLAAFYRRDVSSFVQAWMRWAPFYTYDTVESDDYRAHLKVIAKGRPIVGLATHGGVLTTARQYRTLKLPEIEYLISNTEALFVSLDYDDMTPLAIHLHSKFPGRFIWAPAIVQHWDYAHTAALCGATDINVLVCQSVAHISAAIGAQTRVLAPKRAAWREIKTPEIGNRWFLWPGDNTELLMQDDPESWKKPLDAVIAELKR
jgi:tetratricopeptide (TPR) repeat protein